jgi:hypothetical protein
MIFQFNRHFSKINAWRWRYVATCLLGIGAQLGNRTLSAVTIRMKFL